MVGGLVGEPVEVMGLGLDCIDCPRLRRVGIAEDDSDVVFVCLGLHTSLIAGDFKGAGDSGGAGEGIFEGRSVRLPTVRGVAGAGVNSTVESFSFCLVSGEANRYRFLFRSIILPVTGIRVGDGELGVLGELNL